MSCQLWRDLKRTGPNPREDVLHNLFRWEESAHVSRGARLCRRLKTIRWRWLDVWTLQQSQRISSEALQPETNTSTLLGTEQTRSLQQVGWQYAICWLSHTFDIAGPKKKKKAREKTFQFQLLQFQGCWRRNWPTGTCTLRQITDHHIPTFTAASQSERHRCFSLSQGPDSSTAISIIPSCFSACVLSFSDQDGFSESVLLLFFLCDSNNRQHYVKNI